jgi:hypothetical protein
MVVDFQVAEECHGFLFALALARVEHPVPVAEQSRRNALIPPRLSLAKSFIADQTVNDAGPLSSIAELTIHI